MALDDEPVFPVASFDELYGHEGTADGDEPVPMLSLGSKPSTVLADAVATVREYLHLPDPGRVMVPWAVVVANRQPGDPVWLLEVAASSSGKTEAIGPLADLPDVYPVGALTEPALLSGSPKREHGAAATGGLLKLVGRFGIILVRDFSTVLAMRPEPKAAVLAALRCVYDGHWERHIGADGGKTLEWSGKCGMLGAVTPSIDRHHAVMGALGERFLLYRPSTGGRAELGTRALANRKHADRMREDLAAATMSVLDAATTDAAYNLSDADRAKLVVLATYVAAARTAVDRNGYSHEVEAMPEPEAPGRLVGALAALASGLHGIGADEQDVWRLVHEVAWGCVPEMRKRLLYALKANGECTRTKLTALTMVPLTTADRCLEDLRLLGLVRRSEGGSRSEWAYRINEQGDEWPAP